jgi:hypothetical protein
MTVSDVAEILARIRAYGGELRPLSDGKLSYRGPRLDEELRSLVRDHKAEIMRCLTSVTSSVPDASCLMENCHFAGHVVELAEGLTTRLCAAHRRELFNRARALAASDAKGTSELFARRPCRFCGRQVEPEDDPCKPCAAARSPLVRLAISLGARPICTCGADVAEPGTRCNQCLGQGAR